MPSFQFVPIPSANISDTQIKKIYRENLTINSKKTDRWGILPKSLTIIGDIKYFELAYTIPKNVVNIEGDIKQFNLVRKIPLIILNENLIAIGIVKSIAEEKRIINFITVKLIKGYHLEKMRFNDQLIEKTLNNEVIEVSFQPTNKNNNAIDSIKAIGRSDILNTEFFEEHADKPKKETKFRIKSINSEIGVGFSKNGVVSLPNNIDENITFSILKYIADKLLNPELFGKKFIKNIDSFIKIE